jgi:hypothetical protein
MTGSNKREGLRRLLPVLVLAGIIAAVAAFAAQAATHRAAAKPTNDSAPTISGDTTEGSTLTIANGNWSGGGTITFAYQWRRCDQNGGSCSDISGATQQTYKLASIDNGNTLRAVVTATNSDGSTPATTVPTAVVKASSGGTTSTTTTTTPTPNGCPSGAQGSTVAVADVSSPARLLITQFQADPSPVPGNFQSLTLKVRVGNTCGQIVSGALVYATAVPFNQVNIPAEGTTGSDGWVSLTFNRLRGFPAATKQQLMVMFIRARKPGESLLAGISTRRLVSFKVNLHASS